MKAPLFPAQEASRGTLEAQRQELQRLLQEVEELVEGFLE
jgi:hypothetical protein